MTKQKRTFRYERKFLVDRLDSHQIKGFIRRHPYLFEEPYPPRYVNNFYLDTPEMDNYLDNVVGSSDRRKVRLRWYGDLLGEIKKPIMEFKIKHGMVGTKRYYPFPDFILDETFNNDKFQNLIRQADLPQEVEHLLRGQMIVLMNRYYRRYYATKDNRFRVTLDTCLTYLRVAKLKNRFIHDQTDHRNRVVELKYNLEQDSEAHRVSSYFPFRVTKSSKYVQGIERVYF